MISILLLLDLILALRLGSGVKIEKQNINIQIQTKIHRIVTITSKLELLNPDAQLQRGYALAMDKNHKVIYDTDHINLNDLLQLRFAKGKLIAQVIKKEK